MEVQVEFNLLVELIKKTQAAASRFEFDTVWGKTLSMLLKNNISMVDDGSANQGDRDLLYHAMLQGRGMARMQKKSSWEWPIESEKPLFAAFSVDSKAPSNRACLEYHLDNLEQGLPVVIPPIINIDWHYSGFNEKNAIDSLAPLKSIGPLLILADNYMFAMDHYERISNASKDLTKSLMLFIRGLTGSMGALKQIVVVGARIYNQDEDETTELMDLLFDDLETELRRAGYNGKLGLILSKKGNKGKQKSRHDRHVFTNAGQLVITDSLRLFKSNRPHLTDTLTITYRQYTDSSSRAAIKHHAESLSFQIAAEQRLHVTGSLDEALAETAFSQLRQ